MAPPRRNPPLLLPLLLLAAAIPSLSLRFDLQSGHTKCIAEDMKLNAMSVGKYSVVHPSSVPLHDVYFNHHQDQQTQPLQPLPDSHKILARVTSPHGNNVHFSEKTDSGNFAFTTTEAGNYIACFTAPEHKPPETVTVEFDWRSGVSARDWPTIAKKGQIDIMKQELNFLEETIKAIHEEMFYLREREEQMQDLNRSTNSRMAWLSFLSLSICISVVGLQLWHLKNFFEKKKLI